MPLYHPRILAQKLEDLVLKLLGWSYSATQIRHNALSRQSKMESQLVNISRTAGILAGQLVVDQQGVAQVDAVLVSQMARYSEMKTEVDQILESVQRALDEAQQVLAYQQEESVKAEQWVVTASRQRQHAANDYAHAINTSLKAREDVEQAGGEDETTKQIFRARFRDAETQVSNASVEKYQAERELNNAQAHANDCIQAVNCAREAVQIAEEAQRYVQQGGNALGRSHDYTGAAQKALEEGKMALGREEEAIRATEEVLKIAKITLEEATDSLHIALVHEQCSQEYQVQARVSLDGKILALFALNQPDFNFIYGGAFVDPSPFNIATAERAIETEATLSGYSLSPPLNNTSPSGDANSSKDESSDFTLNNSEHEEPKTPNVPCYPDILLGDEVPDILLGREVLVSGYPKEFAEFNHEQGQKKGYDGTCGIVSCENILQQYGVRVNEINLVNHAIDNNLCKNSGEKDEKGATTRPQLVRILKNFGLPAHHSRGGTLDSLASHIEQDKGVIIGINAGVLWNDASYFGYGEPNHAVVVTGVARDPVTSDILGFYINDSGTNKSGQFVDAATVRLAWENTRGSKGVYVVTDITHKKWFNG